jgi:hypothetical protein
VSIPTRLIAPCGLNCRLCHAYVRDKKRCPGCRGDDDAKSQYCVTCKIKRCGQLVGDKVRYCFDCEEYPCARLRQLDRRYQTRYATCVIDNLNTIKEYGIRHFVRAEKEKRTCPNCGSLICVHKPNCLCCGYKWH